MTIWDSWALLSPAMQTTFAYLDPGTGSLILQAALAAIATIAMMGRIFWSRILVILRLRPPAPAAESTSAEGSSDKPEPSA